MEFPSLYADHHVLAIREALESIQGVDGVTASSAQKRVTLRYDPKKVKAEAIESKLKEAGYEVGKELTLPTPPNGKEDASAWFCVQGRVTTTNRLDLEMSGDFRKY